MLRFALRRFAVGALIVGIVASLTFVLLRLAPGDPFSDLADNPRIPPEARVALRKQFALDGSLGAQYVAFLSRSVRGDLGYSFLHHRPVREVLAEAIPNSLLLMGTGLIAGFLLGIGLGVAQASRPHRWPDRAITVATTAITSLPEFWIALGLLTVFGYRFGLFPISGMQDAAMSPYLSAAGRARDVLHHLVLPASALALVIASAVARFQRAALLDAPLGEYPRTARAKGLSPRAVLWRHTLRNALLPVITLLGLWLPALVGGALFVESIFAWPGLGASAVQGILARDYPLVVSQVVLVSIFVVFGSLVADLLSAWADPRLRIAEPR